MGAVGQVLARARRLSAREQRLAMESAAPLLAALVLRRVMSTQRLLHLSGAEDHADPQWAVAAAARSGEVAEQLCALQRACRLLAISNCLVRATALRILLRRRGIGSTLHIGVRKDEQSRLAAHAWVSVGGRVVLGAEELHRPYAELLRKARFPTTAAR